MWFVDENGLQRHCTKNFRLLYNNPKTCFDLIIQSNLNYNTSSLAWK